MLAGKNLNSDSDGTSALAAFTDVMLILHNATYTFTSSHNMLPELIVKTQNLSPGQNIDSTCMYKYMGKNGNFHKIYTTKLQNTALAARLELSRHRNPN